MSSITARHLLPLPRRALALLPAARLPARPVTDFEICTVLTERPASQHLAMLTEMRDLGVPIHVWSLAGEPPILRDERHGYGPGAKFDLVRELLVHCRPESDVLIVDDDVDWVRGGPTEFVGSSRELDFALAQPAHTYRSFTSHSITVAQPLTRARQTSFVEIGPAFYVRGTERTQFLSQDAATGMGYGTELRWTRIAERSSLRIGIIDAIRVRHLRPVGGGYDLQSGRNTAQEMLTGAGLESWRDMQTTIARWHSLQAVPPWKGTSR